jgi:hypothetical protein
MSRIVITFRLAVRSFSIIGDRLPLFAHRPNHRRPVKVNEA